MPGLDWTFYDGKDEEYHATRLTPALKGFIAPHRHEYAELIFVEQGWCIHRVNNRRILLDRGSLMLVRPRIDIHSFHEHSQNISILRIGIKEDSIDFICNRYVESKNNLWGEENQIPRVYTLNDTQCLWMTRSYRALTRGTRTKLQIERFLINLIDELMHTDFAAAVSPPEEDWLVKAYERLRDPAWFSQGVKELSLHVNRSPEHIARMMKRKFGKTPVELLNESRFSYACEQLAFTNKEIIDIAYECGYSGMSHFYRLFAKHAGKTPSAYRKEKQYGSA